MAVDHPVFRPKQSNQWNGITQAMKKTASSTIRNNFALGKRTAKRILSLEMFKSLTFPTGHQIKTLVVALHLMLVVKSLPFPPSRSSSFRSKIALVRTRCILSASRVCARDQSRKMEIRCSRLQARRKSSCTKVDQGLEAENVYRKATGWIDFWEWFSVYMLSNLRGHLHCACIFIRIDPLHLDRDFPSLWIQLAPNVSKWILSLTLYMFQDYRRISNGRCKANGKPTFRHFIPQ